MSCQRAQELIHGYVDGELELARSLEIEQHIHECDVCGRTYRNQNALRSSLKHASASIRNEVEKRSLERSYITVFPCERRA